MPKDVMGDRSPELDVSRSAFCDSLMPPQFFHCAFTPLECKRFTWGLWATSAYARVVYLSTYYMSKDIRKSRLIVRRMAGSFAWENVGRRIRELRGFQMTQKEFARRIGVSQGHLSYMERGEKEIG